MTTQNVFGRSVILPLTNKSGASVAAGDVVILDSANDDSFTTTTSASVTTPIGVAQQTIASNAVGLVLLEGYASLVNVNASVTRLHYGATHTVAKQATDAGASRVAGTFCVFLKSGTTPDAWVYPVDLAGAALTNPMSGAGDIIVGGASGVPTRLAAGTTSQVLVGGTSPAWGPGSYTSYSPALTASSSNPTLGSGSAVEGHYVQIGKTIIGHGSITFGSSGAAAGSGEYRVSLPVTAVSTAPRIMGNAVLYDDSAATFVIAHGYFSSTTVMRLAIPGASQLLASNSQPWTWAANDAIIFSLMYEAA